MSIFQTFLQRILNVESLFQETNLSGFQRKVRGGRFGKKLIFSFKYNLVVSHQDYSNSFAIRIHFNHSNLKMFFIFQVNWILLYFRNVTKFNKNNFYVALSLCGVYSSKSLIVSQVRSGDWSSPPDHIHFISAQVRERLRPETTESQQFHI